MTARGRRGVAVATRTLLVEAVGTSLGLCLVPLFLALV